MTHALRLPLCVAALGLAAVHGGDARAQSQTGQIQGLITNVETGKPLGGVTVVVTGPALQGEQTEFTGPDGRYTITQLPPGDGYLVRLYFDEIIVEVAGVRIVGGSTLTISRAMMTRKVDAKAYVIREKAPNVDTASSNTGVEINQELLQNTAVRGRTFESVLTLAPGATAPPRGQGGDIGVSLSGSTGNENSYIIDGMNTTDLGTGVLATQVHQSFIKEVNVITGGYQAEYGRATGGVVSVVTKSGSNEFHGSVFSSGNPFQLSPNTVSRLGEAIGTRTRPDAGVWDLGFDLGGPIIKDRLWFYVGFAPTTTVTTTERALRRQSYDPLTGRARRDTGFECYGYLADDRLCNGARPAANSLTELRADTLVATQRLFNYIGKLQFNISNNHNLTLTYLGSPTTQDGYQTYDGFTTSRSYDPDALRYSEVRQVHDLSLRYLGKLLDHKLQVEVLYGLHYQSQVQTPGSRDQAAINYATATNNPYSLGDFEAVPECARQAVTGANGVMSQFNPCPVTSYRRGGLGLYRNQTLVRHQLVAAATYYLNLLGNHALKLGFDFEDNQNDHFRTYTGDPASTGNRVYETDATGTTLRIFAQYAGRNPDGSARLLDSFQAKTETRNYSLYLRDSWNVGKIPGLVLNLGLRWEAQEIFGIDGSRQIAVLDNVAPRLGVTYDFTRKGLSKLYLNYGRFYQAIPMTLNDRQFSGEGVYTGAFTSDCPQVKATPGAGRAVPVPVPGAGAPCSLLNPEGSNLNGGAFGKVAPGLAGQYLNEVVVGVNYDIGWDVVVGAGYSYRSLGNIIEDLSVDGGSNYLIANPGGPPDPGHLSGLQAEVDRLAPLAGGSPQAQSAYDTALARLNAYRSQGSDLPRPERIYHAMMLTAQKRLSNRFSILANYTYSRLYGNYPGMYNATTGDNNPNFSSLFDLPDLMKNRRGPLGNDRPHNFKAVGFYTQPVGSKGTLTAGLTFSLVSGRPINVLGAHPIYGRSEVFLLPAGAGGRTPILTQFDLHVGYEHQLTKALRLAAFIDIINLFNQQQVNNVDDEYTYSQVQPIVGGQVQDLTKLRTIAGDIPVVNPNYGHATDYQAPLYMRLGGRLSF